MPNQQNSQSTLLTTNHSLPISSSVISKLKSSQIIPERFCNDCDFCRLATPGAPPMNPQALHGQAINQVQQQPPMAHMQAAGNLIIYLKCFRRQKKAKFFVKIAEIFILIVHFC